MRRALILLSMSSERLPQTAADPAVATPEAIRRRDRARNVASVGSGLLVAGTVAGVGVLLPVTAQATAAQQAAKAAQRAAAAQREDAAVEVRERTQRVVTDSAIEAASNAAPAPSASGSTARPAPKPTPRPSSAAPAKPAPAPQPVAKPAPKPAPVPVPATGS